MIVLALLIIADAHIATAFAGNQAIVEPTCVASLPTLKRDASPSVLQSLEPMPSTLSHTRQSCDTSRFPPPPSNNHVYLMKRHQDQLYDLVHVFLF
jgi:hypothetical protein